MPEPVVLSEVPPLAKRCITRESFRVAGEGVLANIKL